MLLNLYTKTILPLDKTKINETDLEKTLKLNKLMLKDDENMKKFDFIKNEMTKENVLTFYSLAKLFTIDIF